MWLDTLIEFKKKSGKTIKQISDESGVPLGTLNKLFAKQTREPKLETVRAVAHALGYTLDDLEDKSLRNKKTPTPVAEDGQKDKNIIKIAGRDGSFQERQLTDEQLAAIKAILSQMPDASDYV